MSIGFKIKKLREGNNVSQQELAAALGISQSALSKLENGVSEKIDFLIMDKVCEFFDKDFYYFTEEKVINNIKTNNGQVSCNHITINNFLPEQVIHEIEKMLTSMQNLIEQYQRNK